MGNVLLVLAGVAVVSGLLGFSGAAGALSWPLLGVFWVALLFLLTTALVAAAGGKKLFR